MVRLLRAFAALMTTAASVNAAGKWYTDATFVNNPPASIAADMHVRWDAGTKKYWAYSTEGADEGYFFGIYSSPDLATWSKVPGGALKNESATKLWADDWFWAPECYFNEKTGWYFFFYAGRMLKPQNVSAYFKYPDFEEASKIGVAVSRSPAGPFVNIEARPIDYLPFDPDYNDVNLIMSPPYLVPPQTHEEGLAAPLGTYIPSIDANVFFDDNGAIWLYFSRNAYRNWVWDDVFGKYIEESNIYAVQLDDAWWNDPRAKTLPKVHKKFLNVHAGKPANWTTSVNASLPGPTRKDGFVPVISNKLQPQVWENAHVNDHAASGGTRKDRRWSEGSTTIKRYDSSGHPVYYITYSSNNFESPDYGVGYAVSTRPEGPFVKSTSNPILSQDASKGIFSTGHGSIVGAQGKNNQLYYPHHGRPSVDAPRYMYNARLFIEPDNLYMGFGTNAGDLPLPDGVAPLKMTAQKTGEGAYTVTVKSVTGAVFDLASPKNRLRVLVDGKEQNVTQGASVKASGGSKLTIRYQRARANETQPWADVAQWQGVGGKKQFVELSLNL